MAKPVIDLTGTDYDSLVNQLQALIPSMTPYWREFHDSDPGIVILRLVSALVDQGMFMLDKRTNEMILTRARTKKAVIDHGKLLDYALRRVTAPSVEVVLTPQTQETIPNSFKVLRGSKFFTDDGTCYVTREDSIAYPAAGGGSPFQFKVTAYEGAFFEEVFTANTSDSPQKYTLTGKNVASNYLIVKVKSTTVGDNQTPITVERQWGEDVFAPDTAEAETRYKYFVEVLEDGTTSIIFNDFRYSVPNANDVITVSYLSTDGPAGSIKAGTISSVVNSSLYNVNGVKPFGDVNLDHMFTVTNLSDSVGGDVEEDWSVIRFKIPKLMSTLWRAVSLRDYEDLAGLYPGVLSAVAQRQTVALPYHPDVQNVHAVKVWLLRETDDTIVDSEFLSNVRSMLLDNSVIGVDVQTALAEPVLINIGLEVVIDPRATSVLVKDSIQSVLNDFFKYSQAQIGKMVSLDDVYGTINALQEIVRFRITTMYVDGTVDTTPNHITIGATQYAKLNHVVMDISGGIS
jgi:hypothetical protein